MAQRAWISIAAAAAAAVATTAWAAVPPNIAAALADKGRPAEEAARDAARKPGELLEWAGLKAGDKAVDLVMGGGYFTRIMAVAVGPKGHVWSYQPSEFIQFSTKYGEDLKTVSAAYDNVTPDDQSLASLNLPAGMDFVMTVQNYHDFHLKPFPADTAAKVNAAVYKALKPGGVYVIVDHAAEPGAADAPDALHRIDPAAVKQEVEAAGFKLVGESPLLRNPDDPHTASVFDASIRGKSDQFALKFRKPG